MASKETDARQAWQLITDIFLSSETQDAFHSACADVDLPHPGALKALLLLGDDEPPSMREMAEAMHCDASYITGLVDALEDQGYVERQMSPSDRRVKLVYLSPAGRQARDVALHRLQTPPKALAALSAAETRTLAALMRKVADAAPPS